MEKNHPSDQVELEDIPGEKEEFPTEINAEGFGIGVDEEESEEQQGRLDGDADDGDVIKSSIPFASFNFVNSILGAGILAMPFAIEEAGFLFGIFLVCFIAFLTDYGVNLMIYFGKQHKCNSYPLLFEKAIGRIGFFLVPFFMFSYTLGAMISYSIIIGDTVPVVMRSVFGDDSFVTNRTAIVILCSLLIFLPLSLYKNVARLGAFSFLAVLALVYICSVVLYWSTVLEPQVKVRVLNSNFFPSIGLMSGAYACQHNTFLLYRSLRNNSYDRWKTVTHISVGLSFIALALVAISGNVTYGEHTRGNILNNLPQDFATNLARLSAALVLSLTYPLECFVAREAIQVCLQALSVEETRLYQKIQRIDPLHTIPTLLLVFTTTLVGTLVENLGAVFELSGGFSAVTLGLFIFLLPHLLTAYIIPGLCGIKFNKKSWAMVPSILLLVFGVVSMFAGTGLTLWNVITGKQKG